MLSLGHCYLSKVVRLREKNLLRAQMMSNILWAVFYCYWDIVEWWSLVKGGDVAVCLCMI